jgi:hypothetical protein
MMKIYECADGLLRWYEEGEQPKGAKEYHQAKPAEEKPKEKAVKPSNKSRAVKTK